MQPLSLEAARNAFYRRAKAPAQPGSEEWAREKWKMYCTNGNGKWQRHGEMCERLLWPEDFQS